MQTIEITGATGGSGTYDIYLCDITLANCFLISGSTTIPPNVNITLPLTFSNPSPPPATIIFNETSSLIVKLIDVNTGCEKFIPYYCPSATPTQTPTPTPTQTPSTCLCNELANTSSTNTYTFTYINCEDKLDSSSVPPNTNVYVCGNSVVPGDNLIHTILGPCIEGTCPSYYITPSPTSSVTPTPTPTVTQTPTVTPTTPFVVRKMISCCGYLNEYAAVPPSLIVGDIVKLNDGTCWQVGTTSISPPTLIFVSVFVGDCTACNGFNPC